VVVVVERALASNDPAALSREYLAAFMAVHAAQPVDRQAALDTLYVAVIEGWLIA
jgi:hypothetical protein